MPSEVVGFPVLHASCSARQDQCNAEWSVDLGQSADAHRYMAEIESENQVLLLPSICFYCCYCFVVCLGTSKLFLS